MRDKSEGTYVRGGREDTCDHGLSRRPLTVKPITSWAGNGELKHNQGKKRRKNSSQTYTKNEQQQQY